MDWPDQRLDALIERTVTAIERTVGSRQAAFTWCGNHESLVLERLAGLAGIHSCVFATTDLEYPAYLRWVTDRMPNGVTVVRCKEQNLGWLRANPLMLFPRSTYVLRQWQHLVRRAHEQYFKAENLGILLVGGRRPGQPYAYGPGKQLTWGHHYSPLAADWPPAAMLSLIHREQLPLPPCYGWPRGLQVGPGPWPARPGTTSTRHGFREVWLIDPDIVRSAAEELPLAARWLELTGRS